MSLSAVYNGDLSRVQLTADSLGALATYAVVERALDSGVTDAMWAEGTVRGGTRLPVVSQEFDVGPLDDFEFPADTLNHYRVTSFDNADVQQAQFTDSITPDLAGRVWWKSIRYPALNRPVHVLNWSEIGRGSRTGVADVVGRSTPVATTELARARKFVLELVTDNLYDPTADGQHQAGAWDLVVAAGGVFFIHVPADQPIPGGYVTLGDAALDRTVRSGVEPYVLTLPCQVVTPPAPQVVGSTLVAETVFALYGNANALYAAHTTGRSLLATIGDPEDLVVV